MYNSECAPRVLSRIVAIDLNDNDLDRVGGGLPIDVGHETLCGAVYSYGSELESDRACFYSFSQEEFDDSN